jgi:hypothetical protein
MKYGVKSFTDFSLDSIDKAMNDFLVKTGATIINVSLTSCYVENNSLMRYAMTVSYWLKG